MLITQPEAKRVLEPYHDVFFSCVHLAFEHWATTTAPGLPHFRGRTQANHIQDRADTLLRERLGADPCVQFSLPRRDRFWMILRHDPQHVLVRLKKLNEDFTTSNVRTKASKAFDGQTELLDLPEAPRITLGYQLDNAAASVTGVWVVLLSEKYLHWKYELADSGSGVVVVTDSQLPLSPSPTAAPGPLKVKPGVRKKAQ